MAEFAFCSTCDFMNEGMVNATAASKATIRATFAQRASMWLNTNPHAIIMMRGNKVEGYRLNLQYRRVSNQR